MKPTILYSSILIILILIIVLKLLKNKKTSLSNIKDIDSNEIVEETDSEINSNKYMYTLNILEYGGIVHTISLENKLNDTEDNLYLITDAPKYGLPEDIVNKIDIFKEKHSIFRESNKNIISMKILNWIMDNDISPEDDIKLINEVDDIAMVVFKNMLGHVESKLNIIR